MAVSYNMRKETERDVSGSVVHDETAIAKDQDMSTNPPKDIGAKYADAADEAELSAGTERKYLRRIDMMLMPIMFLTYGLQYADKSILPSAAQFGVVQDLGLSETSIVDGEPSTSLSRYSNTVSIFYWGYLAGSMHPGLHSTMTRRLREQFFRHRTWPSGFPSGGS